MAREQGLPHGRSSCTIGGMQAPYALLPGTRVPLPGPEAAFIGLAAFAVVMIPFLWPLVDQVDTMAHEGAHAVVASALGFTVLGVTLDRESNGVTSYPASGSGPRRLLVTFAGYLGPSGFGLGAAKLIETGHLACVPWVATILLVLLLFLVRRSFGVVSVPAAIALLAVVMRYARDGLEEIIVYGMTWLLLLSGARNAVAHGAPGTPGRSARSLICPAGSGLCCGWRARSWPSPSAENGWSRGPKPPNDWQVRSRYDINERVPELGRPSEKCSRPIMTRVRCWSSAEAHLRLESRAGFRRRRPAAQDLRGP
jgi:hypothetical protein